VVTLVPFLMLVAAVIAIVTFAAIVPTIIAAVVSAVFRAVFAVLARAISGGPGGRVGCSGGLPAQSGQRGEDCESGNQASGMDFHGCSVNMAIGLGDTVSLGT
jgi:hypothetical protein